MKNILVFIDWYWPGYKAGGTVRAFLNMVSYMKDDFVFHIITRDTDYTESSSYASVKSNEWNKITENVRIFYASKENISLGIWKKLIRETHFDMVYVHGIFSFWFSILPLLLIKNKTKKKILVAAHGMLGDHAFQVKPLKKGIFIWLIRLTGLYKDVAFHAANTQEAIDIRKRAGKKVKIHIADELPQRVRPLKVRPRKKEPGRLRLAWVARIAPEKNLKYALEVLSGIEEGEIWYDLYGPVYDERYWEECREIIRTLPPNVHVSWKGSLAGDQVMKVLQDYHALFLPTTGENFGHAILESMMSGCPVIISDRTPWRDLEKNGCGFDIPLEKIEVFQEKIAELAGLDQGAFDSLTHRTLQFIEDYTKSPAALKENYALFNDMIS